MSETDPRIPRAKSLAHDLSTSAIRSLRELAAHVPAALAPATMTLLLRTAESITMNEVESFAATADRGYGAFDDLMELGTRLGIPAYAVDGDGFFRQYNRAAFSLWGWAPPLGVQRWFGSHQHMHRDGSMLLPRNAPLPLALRERRRVADDTILSRRPDGYWNATRPLAVPILGGQGGVLGGVTFLMDVRRRVELEWELFGQRPPGRFHHSKDQTSYEA